MMNRLLTQEKIPSSATLTTVCNSLYITIYTHTLKYKCLDSGSGNLNNNFKV